MSGVVLKDIGLLKNRILPILLNSNDVMEILLGVGYTHEQVWGTAGNEEDCGILFKQVFPYLYMSDIQSDHLSYVCFEVDIPRMPSNTIKEIKIIIWAYCHKNSMRYSKADYTGTKADILADAIEREFRSSLNFGIGRLNLDSITYLTPSNSQYYGKQLIFTVPDFKVK